MANRRLDRCGVDPFILDRLQKIGITTGRDLLDANHLTLMVQTDLGNKEVKKLVQGVAERICPPCKTALDLMNERSQHKCFISTGIPALDTAMRGGVPIGSITEIAGVPGTGKTQFVIGCCVQVVSQLIRDEMSSSVAYKAGGSVAFYNKESDGSGGYGRVNAVGISEGVTEVNIEAEIAKKKGGVIYFDTEMKFNPLRLQEIAIKKFPDLYSSECTLLAPQLLDRLTSCIIVNRPTSCQELLVAIEELQMKVLSEGITMIVIDSIAALARQEGLQERDKEIYIVRQAAVLKHLADKCGCVILTTNQMAADYSTSYDDDALGDRVLDTAGNFRPTLGPIWFHCVTTRVVLFNVTQSEMDLATGSSGAGAGADGSRRNNDELVSVNRILQLTKSPIAPSYSLKYYVGASGIVATPL